MECSPSRHDGVPVRSDTHGGGAALALLLRQPSLALRLLDRLLQTLQTWSCVRCALLRVHTPGCVGAVRADLAAVEGEAFAAAEAGSVVEAFELLALAARSSPLNAAGRIFVQQLMEKAARTRRGIYGHIARNPSLALRRVSAPVFIIGLPRTGSTHLQALLAADAKTETIRFWEMMAPLPPAALGSTRARLRCASLAFQLRLMELLAPGWNAANDTYHAVAVGGPEEEAVLLAGCGVSLMPFVCLGGPDSAYEAMHTSAYGKRAAFRYLRRFLQLASATRPAGDDARWVLKSHYNALWAETLLDEFPDAKVIVTVREPLEVVQSFLSYAVTNLSFIAQDGEGERVARGHAAASYRYLQQNAAGLVALQRRFQAQAQDGRLGADAATAGSGSAAGSAGGAAGGATRGALYVLPYEELIARPFEAMREIYARLDIPLTDDALARAAAYLRQNRQHSAGKPLKVAIGDVGLSLDQIERDFTQYRAELLTPATAAAAARRAAAPE